MRRLAVLILFVIATAPAHAQRSFTLDVGGATRSYIVHTPPGARPEPGWPLVILLHGGGGNARQAMRAYGMNDVSDREGFLVAYPNGSGRFSDVLLTWNSGNCCAFAYENDVNDVAFMRAMVEKIDGDFGLDRSRIFATGMSNGGMLSHRLGCEAADVFAAIAPVAGALNIACRPRDEVAVMIIHGTADEHVPYEGGTGPKTLDERVDNPVSHAVETWRRVNGCSKPAAKTSANGVIRRSWESCREGTAVELVTIVGGGHAWPGGESPMRQSADEPSQAISASEEIWKFFAAHPKK